LEDYPLANTEFNKMHNIKLLQFGVPGNKEPFVDIPEEGIVAALTAVLDKRNHPMLIHCNKGKVLQKENKHIIHTYRSYLLKCDI
jgi:tyrosine-protein phosphatase SIW14